MINKLKKALDNQESIKSTIKIFKANRLYWENSRVYPSRNKRRKKYGNR